MRLSTLFSRTLREPPRDEASKNAQLLIRAGYIDKLMAGVYSFLPLGLLLVRNIEAIVREEMDRIGGQEILMPALHPIENYEKTGRENIKDLFHTKMTDGRRLVLGQSHEEVVVPLLQKFVHSYRDLPSHPDLPLAVYQIQTKFRNELRVKSGLLRGREFLMKDMYSFHRSEADFEAYYKIVRSAYEKIFTRAGIGEKTFYTYAGGGTFSKFSHEFQTVTDAGEDVIYVCEKCRAAVNKEVFGEFQNCQECEAKLEKSSKSIEVANIFPLKTRFSEAFDMAVKDESSKETPVVMGCYGIGITRLMGAIAELHNDEKGLIWPQEVAPFQAHLIEIGAYGKPVYEDLLARGIKVLYDDRDLVSAGEKFADADLIGIPLRIVASAKTLAQNSVEVKKRDSDKVELIKIPNLYSYISKNS